METPKITGLLIRFSDSREYLVSQDHLLQILELVKTFSAEIYRVEIISGELTLLEKLPSSLCNPAYKLNADYKELEQVFPNNKSTIEHPVCRPLPVILTKNLIRDRAVTIKEEIKTKFLSGVIVSLKSLADEHEDIHRSTLSHYMSVVRSRLNSEGYTINRVGVGRYQVGMPPAMWGMPTLPNYDTVFINNDQWVTIN